MKRFLIATAAFFFCIACAGIVTVQWAYGVLQAPAQDCKVTESFVVEPGQGYGVVIDRLIAEGCLKNPLLWRAYGSVKGIAGRIKAGEYAFEPDMSGLALIDKLVLGDVRLHTITFVEGITYHDLLTLLRAHEAIEYDLPERENDQLPSVLAGKIDHPEGWFFPDTYRFERGLAASQLLVRAHEQMKQILMDAWHSRAVNLPYQKPYEALIMASIVEKETGAEAERHQIAGVFVRRLVRGMRLQTDPTVIYGLSAKFDGNLRRKDLKHSTPYNTYRIDGLPPTPIAMPGRGAIEAALHPSNGTSLYFVARGDGGHYFSDTLEEHNGAVRKYQIYQRSKVYRSTPESQRD